MEYEKKENKKIGLETLQICQKTTTTTTTTNKQTLKHIRNCWFFDVYDNKAVLEPRVSPAFAITFFCIHCNILDLKIHQSMWIHWPFFPKTWTKGHWPLDDLWPHVCWGHMCDSTQGSLCPSPMTIHQCMWIQWSILQNTTYIHIHTYTYIHTTYRMSDHIVSYWTQFRQDKNLGKLIGSGD